MQEKQRQEILRVIGLRSRSEWNTISAELRLDPRPGLVEECVYFVITDNIGWSRARALIARRLKHCLIPQQQQEMLVTCIAERLRQGRFFEQFKDQLRLALQLDKLRMLKTASACLTNQHHYVQRYAEWILKNYGQDG